MAIMDPVPVSGVFLNDEKLSPPPLPVVSVEPTLCASHCHLSRQRQRFVIVTRVIDRWNVLSDEYAVSSPFTFRSHLLSLPSISFIHSSTIYFVKLMYMELR
ncbi:hypothetical protein PRIPAC_73987 [Pristionchus pacificus]|uniref:Uncharacterized protein n=1 Tax=Pristionchus pacificus TaxID=54126 RepID=A0A2A6CG13_PRIPA|nr:hypothetical protein PRIPAC_73987 [Pristionchus pacificus]|eukprot:PDM76961.1 hypothetical protein PRIPAC_42356 [Pristionchus pacificus]